MTMMEITHTQIRSFFSSFDRNVIHDPALVPAGVLVPLFIRNGELHIIFTLRTDQVEYHKGEVSFPGGTMDDVDSTVIETALREAKEEIGLTQSAVEILGVADDFRTPNGFCITPVVGFLTAIPSFVLNKIEVSEVFDVPLSFFLDSHNERVEQRKSYGRTITVYFYNYNKYEIWGATAAIVRTFLQALNAETRNKKTL